MIRTVVAFAATALVATSLVAAPCKDAKGRCHVAAGPKKGQLTKCPG